MIASATLLQLRHWLVIINGTSAVLRVRLLARRPRYWTTRTRAGASRTVASSGSPTLVGVVPASSGRSSTCSSARPSTSRTCASASSRSRRWRIGSRRRDLHCPVCRTEVDPSYPRLPDLHDEAQAGVRELQGAARGDLAGVSVLRDPDRAGAGEHRRRSVRGAAAAHPDRSRRRYSAAGRWPSSRHSS